jgi:succinate-semialdehyde dehydrogenase/glutarate-semialdehyde dehydrogenase
MTTSPIGERAKMYVGGEWVGATSDRAMAVRNPATGEVLAHVPDASREDVWRAIDQAATAFPKWAHTPGIERGRILRRIHDLMTERRDALARLVTQENGKPLEEAKREVAFATGYFSWFAEEARRAHGEIVSPPVAEKRLWVMKQPMGVIGAITPWNFPATMVTRKIAPALAAGCTVVLKPASATPLSALALARISDDAGLPPGVFNVVTTKNGSVAGQAFLDHAAVRKIAFTGSTEVGKRLMAGASEQLKRVSFELGGNAPFIVFEDADLAAAADAAISIKFLRVGGQSCICANRVYVQASIAERFIPMFVDRAKALRVAPGFESGAQIGPLINAEIFEKVDSLVRSAVRQGAVLLAGGGRLAGGSYGTGFFYAPTVLSNVSEEMDVAKEEIFGPVAPVMTFGDEAEVIERSNATALGLAAYFYTRDLRRSIRVAEALEYGMVGVNDASGYTHEIPFGGFKQSGLGREGGHQGIEEYMEVKSISLVV